MNKLVKMGNFGNEDAPEFISADEWELTPVVVNGKTMSAGLFLNSEDRESAAIQLDLAGCVEIAGWLNDHAARLCTDGDDIAKSIRTFANGVFGKMEYDRIYIEMRKIAQDDMMHEADGLKDLAKRAGLAESKVLIGKLAEAAAMGDGKEKMQIMEELLPEIQVALG